MKKKNLLHRERNEVLFWVKSIKYRICKCGQQFKSIEALTMHINAMHIMIEK